MTQEPHDAAWNAAWDWVQREYDRDTFDEVARAALAQWLLADPSHRKAYEKASRLWLLAGLVPPAGEPGVDGEAGQPPGFDAPTRPRGGKLH